MPACGAGRRVRATSAEAREADARLLVLVDGYSLPRCGGWSVTRASAQRALTRGL